jgi:hypothetical protein
MSDVGPEERGYIWSFRESELAADAADPLTCCDLLDFFPADISELAADALHLSAVPAK